MGILLQTRGKALGHGQHCTTDVHGVIDPLS